MKWQRELRLGAYGQMRTTDERVEGILAIVNYKFLEVGHKAYEFPDNFYMENWSETRRQVGDKSNTMSRLIVGSREDEDIEEIGQNLTTR